VFETLNYVSNRKQTRIGKILIKNPKVSTSQKRSKNNVVKSVLRSLESSNSKNSQVVRVPQQANSIPQAFRTPFYSFVGALHNPFDPEALGVRVPDPFNFPTTTSHLHSTTVGDTTAGGNGCCCFLNNPVLTMLDMVRLNSGSISISSSGMTQPFNFQGFYGASSLSALGGLYATERVVCSGIKISNLQPELSATGRIIIAQVPVLDQFPGYSELVAAAPGGDNFSQLLFGQEISALASSKLLQLPGAYELAVQDLLHGDVQIVPMYTNSSFFNFRATADNTTYNSTNVVGNDTTYTTSTLVANDISWNDIVTSAGSAAIIVYWEGMPASTANVLQFEYIMHLEGTPTLISAATSSPVTASGNATSVGTIEVVERGMATLNSDSVNTWLEKGTQFLNKTAAFMTSGVTQRKLKNSMTKVGNIAALGAQLAANFI